MSEEPNEWHLRKEINVTHIAPADQLMLNALDVIVDIYWM